MPRERPPACTHPQRGAERPGRCGRSRDGAGGGGKGPPAAPPAGGARPGAISLPAAAGEERDRAACGAEEGFGVLLAPSSSARVPSTQTSLSSPFPPCPLCRTHYSSEVSALIGSLQFNGSKFGNSHRAC